MNAKLHKSMGEPAMSDKTLLVSVEDLIAGAFGTFDDNTVNFQLLQSILIILARQLRMLEQDVEITFDDIGIDFKRRAEDQDSPQGKERDATGHRIARVGSLQVVTISQFALLEQAVRDLEQIKGPLPTPSMPDNQQLRADLAKGRASLSDTMGAMQVNARVQAAEQGLTRMAELLTQLAAVGVLPPDVAANIGQMRADLMQAALRAARKEHGAEGPAAAATAGQRAEGADSMGWLEEVRDKQAEVTFQEMAEHIHHMKDAIKRDIEDKFTRANNVADTANTASKNVSDKLDIALKMNDRMNTLLSETADYAGQLSVFDSGLTTQLASFQEQMGSMQIDLTGGLKLFNTANNSAETAALQELHERCDDVSQELESTINQHKTLDFRHTELCEELKNLIECVEMLREQKADRDEVNDGLRDKADLTLLVGMLQDTDFAEARYKLEQRLAQSNEQFKKLDTVWQNVLKELMSTVERKAEFVALIGFKKSTEDQLTKIQEELQKLEILLGEPKAAILMRKISKDAACGACLTRSLIEPKDRTYGMPLPLPALRPPPPEPCAADLAPALAPPDTREHVCHRWAGGSHTLLPNTVAREKPCKIELQLTPTKKYTGYGNDGRLYLMEEDLQPCAECNRMSAEFPGYVSPQVSTPTGGGGDQSYH